MGVMSRRVLPACGRLCFFCPSLRARSRQPVKRYKKLLADIFPKSQDGQPNDRMISKLCEYASKNPMRVPKITNYLEQRCYKELRAEHIYMAKVVPYIYRKLLASCKELMPLFATSLLGITRTLLDQSRHDDMLILGCYTLVDFLNNQTDSTYMFNLEGFIPKLCQLAQEPGNARLSLRAASLQALASMVHFMGEHSHISMDFDDIVSATLENYRLYDVEGENGRVEDHSSLNSASDNSNSPAYWSRICLHNMADLAREATTVRRVLEPLFRCFDAGHHWSPQSGIAQSVISDMQTLMEKSGQSSHLLLSFLVKHLDHKNVVRRPEMQLDIVKVTTSLAHHAKFQSSTAIVTAISELMRHLRRCLQNSIEAFIPEDETNQLNHALHSALEDCLVQLMNKVGDVGPILDMIAVVLENISMTAVVARTTLSTVYITARIASSLPNIEYHKKVFPEALLHQLLIAMTHPDHETRVGSHRVLSTILVPTMVFPWSVPLLSMSKKYDRRGSILVALSGFSSSSAMLEKMDNFSVPIENGENKNTRVEIINGKFQHSNGRAEYHSIYSHHDQSQNTDAASSGKKVLTSMRLSSHQVGLLLSSLWVQSVSLENTPANYEAIAQTFNLALVFSQAKAPNYVALVRCFQLALSLRNLSLDQEGCLTPPCRRSLFTTTSSMLVLSAKAGSLHNMVSSIKSLVAVEMDDPHLRMVEDGTLQAVYTTPGGDKIVYGSNDDTAAALRFISAIEADDRQLKEMVTSYLLDKFQELPQEELLTMKEQIIQQFSPEDDVFPHGAPLFMETPKQSSPKVHKENESMMHQIMPSSTFEDEDELPEQNASQSDNIISEPQKASDILNVNQLMESVLETARQVASLPVTTTSVPYDQMKDQCEALVVGKQQKMSVLFSFKQQSQTLQLQDGHLEENDESLAMAYKAVQIVEPERKLTGNNSKSSEGDKSFKLPPSSPYDKFMKAAGC